MTAQHLLLVEEQSMEAFLHCLLPRLLPEGHTFEVHPFRGKHDLRKKLKDRLRGYARWLPDEYRIIVMVDRDNDDCKKLKAELEAAATAAGLRTRSQAGSGPWQVANRIVIEELEASSAIGRRCSVPIPACRQPLRGRHVIATRMLSAGPGKRSSAS